MKKTLLFTILSFGLFFSSNAFAAADGVCGSCPSNCVVKGGVCTACSVSGYTCTYRGNDAQVTGQDTLLECCAHCSDCRSSSTSAVCYACASGYYLSGQSCLSGVACSSGCANCNHSTGVCSSCTSGHYLSGNTCHSCPSISNGTCTSCTSSSSSSCTSATCYSGYTFNSSTHTCVSSTSSSCTSTCTTDSGCCTVAHGTGTCQRADWDSSQYTCGHLSCNSGYFAVGKGMGSSGSCYASSGSACLPESCRSGGGSSSGDSNSGSAGSGSAGGASTTCPTECSACTSSTNCTACKNGYYLSSGSCLSCSSKYTITNGTCTKCTSSACTEITCTSGYKLNSTNTACLSGVKECTDSAGATDSCITKDSSGSKCSIKNTTECLKKFGLK